MSRPALSKLSRQFRTGAQRWSGETMIDYTAYIATEKETHRDCLDVRDLPPVFHYWSNRYVRPRLELFGFSTRDEMFRAYVEKQFLNGRAERRIARIGAGNCHLEVELASHLSNRFGSRKRFRHTAKAAADTLAT